MTANLTRPTSLWHRIFYPFRRGTLPAGGEPSGFFTDTSLCIGCKACQVACKHWNMLPAAAPGLTGHSYDNTGQLTATTWRWVKFAEVVDAGQPANNTHSLHWRMMSDACKHCGEPPCLDACPTGALIRSEHGGIYVQADICNGCASCVAACPFGVIMRDADTGHSHKCTLCLDRTRDGLIPACAKTCPTGSIYYGPMQDVHARARARLESLHALGASNASLYGLEPTAQYPPLGNVLLLCDTPSRYGLPETPRHPRHLLAGDYLRAVLGLAGALGVVVLSLFVGGVL